MTNVKIEDFDFTNFDMAQSNAIDIQMIKNVELKKINFKDNTVDSTLEKKTDKTEVQTSHLIKLSGVSKVLMQTANFTNNFDTSLFFY